MGNSNFTRSDKILLVCFGLAVAIVLTAFRLMGMNF